LGWAERKLQVHEVPHNIYIQNYSTASATCLALRRWLFSPQVELLLARDDLISAYMFWQTVDEVNRGHVMAGENLYQLKAMQDINRRSEVHIPSPRVFIFCFFLLPQLLFKVILQVFKNKFVRFFFLLLLI
jgi:hypothetical protein